MAMKGKRVNNMLVIWWKSSFGEVKRELVSCECVQTSLPSDETVSVDDYIQEVSVDEANKLGWTMKEGKYRCPKCSKRDLKLFNMKKKIKQLERNRENGKT